MKLQEILIQELNDWAILLARSISTAVVVLALEENSVSFLSFCEECKKEPECEYCFCEGLPDQTILFLTVRPHDKAYKMR